MLSLKLQLRKTIATAMASVMITTVFVGCAGTTDSVESTLIENVTSVSTASNSDLTPGVTDTDAIFSIKYKYWYDSDYVKELQNNTLSTKAGDAVKYLLGLEALPIHTDDDNEYIISGRTQVYLDNDKISLADFSNLRTEEEGQHIYAVSNITETIKGLEEYDAMLEANGIVPPTSIEERQSIDDLADEKAVPAGLTVFVNNLETNYTTSDSMIDISTIYKTVSSLGALMVPDDTQASVTMFTAAGEITIYFNAIDSGIEVTYSSEKDKVNLESKDISLADHTIQMTPDTLERILGYDVEIYDTHINIVTDNKDIFTPDTIVAQDTITEWVDVGQIIVIEENNTPEPTKPEAETTPDGKYTLAETDLVNEDGTYTQDLSSVNTLVVPDFLSDKDPSLFVTKGKTANPSKIPYSEITLENAAEAFPYLGFIGYVPDYLEILPTDGEAQIRIKVMQNMSGTPTIYCTGYSEAQYPGHYFSSESEYNAYVAQQEAERAAADAADAKAREDSEAGRFGFDGSQEDTDALLNYIESLGL